MPAYNAAPPRAIARWEQAQLLNEAGVSTSLPYKSQQAALVPNAGKLGRHADVAVQFGGAPGAFSFVVEGAITDADANYTAQGTPITAADNNNLVSQKLDISEQIAFIRVKFTALANNVNVAATITPD
jgi:hypothetical protein